MIRVLPYGIAFAAVLVCALFADPHTLRAVDLFPAFRPLWLFSSSLAIWGAFLPFPAGCQEFLTGREVLVAVLASQVTSNVPAALLLSGFTAETQALIIGTNLLGGLSSFASTATLIFYRQLVPQELQRKKQHYFRLSPPSLLFFPALLLGVLLLLRSPQLTYCFSIILLEFRTHHSPGTAPCCLIVCS